MGFLAEIKMMEYALLLPFLLAAAAFLTKSLDTPGTLTGLLMGYGLLLAAGFGWFFVMLVFFVAASLATRYRYAAKRRIRQNQRVRGAEHVLANGIVSLLMALSGNFYGFLGAMASAAADTLSSEIGVLSRSRPRLVTTLEQVPAGTNGGVTSLGTAAGLLGALLVGASGLLIVNSLSVILVAAVAGMIGCFMDSYIGAVFERRGLVRNWTTNLLATISGAVAGMLLGLL